MDSVYIRQFKQDDWAELRSIRLNALQNNPTVFLSSYHESVTFPPEHWQEMLSTHDRAIFGLFDGEKIIGVTGVVPSKYSEENHVAICVMSYIDPEYRGKGYSQLFYSARLDWARQNPLIKVVRVSHREGNIASCKANQKFGFKLVRKEMITWPDGTQDFEYIYDLVL